MTSHTTPQPSIQPSPPPSLPNLPAASASHPAIPPGLSHPTIKTLKYHPHPPMNYGRSNTLSRTTNSYKTRYGTRNAKSLRSSLRKLVNITTDIPLIFKRKIANLKKNNKTNKFTVPSLVF